MPGSVVPRHVTPPSPELATRLAAAPPSTSEKRSCCQVATRRRGLRGATASCGSASELSERVPVSGQEAKGVAPDRRLAASGTASLPRAGAAARPRAASEARVARPRATLIGVHLRRRRGGGQAATVTAQLFRDTPARSPRHVLLVGLLGLGRLEEPELS